MSSNPSLRLVADIGGTNARFALYRAGGAVAAPMTVRTDDFPSPAVAIQAFLAREKAAPEDAAIAVACPIMGDEIHLTNSPWRFSVAALRQELGLRTLRVYNDFAAIALALPWLEEKDARKIGGGEGRPDTPIALVGPGTGLGVSAAIPGPGGTWIPLASEGGHVGFAAADDFQDKILKTLRRTLGRVSAERVMSGPGLENLYAAVTAAEKGAGIHVTAQEVGMRARQNEPAAMKALSLFAETFGAFAGDLVLTLGAWGGLYIGGGVILKLGDLFDVAAFNASFENKGRFQDLLKTVPRWIVTRENPALLGLARALDRQLDGP